MITILICDDQATVRDGLRLMLGLEPDIDVIATAQDGAEAVELARQLRPDVVLMDLKMPVLNGIEATRRICGQLPETQVLVLTTYDADEWVFDAISAGAAGYLLKDTSQSALAAAVRGTAQGRNYVDPNVAGKLMRRASGGVAAQQSSALIEQLNLREQAILRLLAHGMSNSEIAAHLRLSEGTVRNYISNLLDKLGVADRTHAAILALRHGFG